MFLLEWTASDLLMIVVAAAAMIGTVLWLVPGAKVARRRSYSQAEITAYDHQVPRYFLAAAAALLVGAIHVVVKSIPGFWQWLWEAGYGGHLFRDLANSHIIIVGGGTVLLTGITWYVLPRLVNRPLYSTALASASFWFTIAGVFGFYAAWLVLGLVEGNMVRHGMDYMAAKELVGAWHRVPTRMTASIMGIGYWTYVLNVMLTALVGRHVGHKPLGHLTKFAVVSAAALFVGTVQGVLQVLPDNADWIHYAGKFGEYVDPISHAHVNLVTGMMVSLAGFLAFFAPRLSGRPISKKKANRIFWTLVPGSLLFYLSFLFLGLVLGGAANGYGGIQAPALAAFLASKRPLILAVAGTLMLAGFWVYFVTLWHSLKLGGIWQQIGRATPPGFWLASSLALVLGTFQGLLQVIPGTAHILTTPQEVPNIHAQLNMIGGVLLALMGLVYLLVPELLKRQVPQRLSRITLYGVAGGIGGYYLTTLTTGLLRLSWMNQGLSEAASADKLGWLAPATLMLTALPMLVGFLAFGTAIYRTTAEYRAELIGNWRLAPARFTGPMPARLKRLPVHYVLGAEFVGGLFGWPGLGWLFAGKAIPAVALLMIGPSIAWALLPILFSPFSDTVFSQWGWPVLLVWLPVSAALSSAILALVLRRRLVRAQVSPTSGYSSATSMIAVANLQEANLKSERVSSDGEALANLNGKSTGQPAPITKQKRKIGLPALLGLAVIVLALVSIPIVPLFVGVPDNQEQPPLMAELPERANGPYLELDNGNKHGLLKLYAWSFPLDESPKEAPSVNPDFLSSLLISQKGLDTPEQYRLYHMEDGDLIPLRPEEVAFQRQLRLTPSQPLEPGDYMLDIPTGGMFAGREYYYFRIDPQVTTLPPVVAGTRENAAAYATPASETSARTSTGWLEIFPLGAALISASMVAIMLRRLRQKVRPQEAAWTVAFTMFAIAAGSQVVGDVWGWSPALARLYYVFGATLVVGWLGLGTWLVLIHKPWLRRLGTWLMILLSGFGLGLVAMTPVDGGQLALEGWQALDKPALLTVLTIAINSLGTLVLVGGALWSAYIFWRKRIMPERMHGLVLLAVGALVVAAGGSLTRLGHQQYLYIAMSLGIGLMFWGYLKTIGSALLKRPAVPVLDQVQAIDAAPQAPGGD